MFDQINKLLKSEFEVDTIEYENDIISKLAIYICLSCSIANLIFFAIVNPNMITKTLFDSVIIGSFGFAYYATRWISIDSLSKMRLLNLITAVVTVYLVLRYYPVIGTTVWTLTFVIIISVFLRESLEPLVMFSSVLLILGLGVWYKHFTFEMDTTYYISQLFAFVLLNQ